MLIDIKAKLDEEAIQELLGWSVFPEPEHLERAVQRYKDDASAKLLGYVSEDEIIGLIGYHYAGSDTIEIDHIAVDPSERYKGYGRGIILELLELEKPAVLLAETDEEAVDFYRSSRFTVESLGEKYPGTERFKCTYYADEDDSE
ncbi:GNAT family N-acetyltransferase [Paenibacillus lignilyticus]|uniref:GNAT family N-acetyltransferase n=1 Tax=Paenibacillus lignilyticus TaxID=1172615 RepID=A0ABS5CFL2_9BACL|nr:GNAT family N-acetyltransferase [Paenibacillus lignilyticus]MBP3964631.1 GNAT family N-acetyltransferase [Paenibacillus lignilyticus]